MSTAKATAKIAKLGHPEVELVAARATTTSLFTGTVDGADAYETVSVLHPVLPRSCLRQVGRERRHFRRARQGRHVRWPRI